MMAAADLKAAYERADRRRGELRHSIECYRGRRARRNAERRLARADRACERIWDMYIEIYMREHGR